MRRAGGRSAPPLNCGVEAVGKAPDFKSSSKGILRFQELHFFKEQAPSPRLRGCNCMSKKRKRKVLPPRRKRMKRQGRLTSARIWLAKFSGKNVVRSYAKWFGVDLLCAVKELSLLGVSVDPQYVAQLKTTFAARRTRGPKTVEQTQSTGYGVDWDDNFAYIAGRTEGGFPYGVTWEELTDDETVAATRIGAPPTVDDEKF